MWTGKRFWRAKGGATSVEYALIGTVISLLVVLGATSIGTKINAKFAPIVGNLN